MASEDISAQHEQDGFVAITVERDEGDGVHYRSTLYFAPGDTAAVADAVAAVATSFAATELTLSDGRLNVFPAGFGPARVGLELHRDDALPHGGYDTLDILKTSVDAFTTAVRGALA